MTWGHLQAFRSGGWRVGGPAVGEPGGVCACVLRRNSFTGSRAGPHRPSKMSGVFLAHEPMCPVADGISVWADKIRSHRNLYFRLWAQLRWREQADRPAAGTRNGATLEETEALNLLWSILGRVRSPCGKCHLSGCPGVGVASEVAALDSLIQSHC